MHEASSILQNEMGYTQTLSDIRVQDREKQSRNKLKKIEKMGINFVFSHW